MKNKYTEYKNLELPKIEKEIISFWEKQSIFEKTKYCSLIPSQQSYAFTFNMKLITF